jgi:hypothetical protein
VTTNLKPCPFCVGNVGIESIDSTNEWFINHDYKSKMCKIFDCILFNSEESAIDAWNTRRQPISTELPTEPGLYWWREKDGDEWIMLHIEFSSTDKTMKIADMTTLFSPWPTKGNPGQWVKIERPKA